MIGKGWTRGVREKKRKDKGVVKTVGWSVVERESWWKREWVTRRWEKGEVLK